MYQRGVNSFEQFRSSHGFSLCWPAPCSHIVSFIAALSLEGKAPSTISSYLAGVAFNHKINGWDDPLKAFVIQKLLEGSRRLNRRTDSRAPLTLAILRELIPVLERVCRNSYEACLFRSAFLLAFFAFLRVGEFTAKSRSDNCHKVIALSDISFVDPGNSRVQLTLRYSKTDQLGRASIIDICSGSEGAVCPVSALKSFILMRPRVEGPLFLHLDRTPLTRYQVQSVLSKALVASGRSALRFRTHSFRIGAATTAAVCGIGSDEIKRLGRWRSSAFQLYIRPQWFQ